MESSHLSEEKAEIYSMGRVVEPELGLIEAHLLTCEHCQVQVERMDEFVGAMRGSAKSLEDAPPSLLDRVRGFVTFHPGSAWAGAAAAAAAVIIFTVLPPGPRSPQHLELSTFRGAEPTSSHAKPNTPIDLQLDVTELPVSSLYTIELVDVSGRTIRTYTAEPRATKLSVAIGERLPKGQYWVRLYGNSLKSELLREYNLHVD
jgi:hypothetical protein